MRRWATPCIFRLTLRPRPLFSKALLRLQVAEVHETDLELLQEFRIMDFSLLIQPLHVHTLTSWGSGSMTPLAPFEIFSSAA